MSSITHASYFQIVFQSKKAIYIKDPLSRKTIKYLTIIILFSCLLWLSSPEILRLKFPNVGAIHWIVKLNSQKDYHYILLSLTSQNLERKKILYLLKLYKRACGNLRALCGCGVRWIQMLQRLRLSEPKQWNLSVQIKIWRLGVW